MYSIIRCIKLTIAALLVVCAAQQEAAGQTQKTIYFNSSKITKSKRHGYRQDDGYGKNTLTVSLLSYLDGYTAFSYERMINEFFTISAGAGITYKNVWMQVGDQISSLSHGQNGSHAADVQDIEDEYGDFAHRKALMGAYVSLVPKFYPKNESLDGSYFAPMLEYRNYRFGAQRAVEMPVTYGNFDGSAANVPRSGETMNETVRCLDVSAVWGGHYQLRGHLVLDYHAGFGIRSLKASRQDLGYQMTTSDKVRFINDINNYTTTRWMANIGFALGGWW